MHTTNAIEAIMEALAGQFANYDAAFVRDSINWGLARWAAVREFRASDEGKALAMSRDQKKYYDRAFAIAGGKTWYQMFDGRNDAMIVEVMERQALATIAKRNATIAVKLHKAGVVEVTAAPSFARTNDGFNGVFQVAINAGSKVVEIQTIYAGGYNVQRLHTRTLVKVH